MSQIVSYDQLIDVFQSNIKIINDNPNLKLLTEQAIKSTKIYNEGFKTSIHSKENDSHINVCEDTSFCAAKKLKEKYNRVAVLNFANAVNPGGGVTIGAKAQEESLCRCSNLYNCLKKIDLWNDYYKYHRQMADDFYSDRIIYSKDITVFMTDEELPKYTEDWFAVDVITCAAPNQIEQPYINRAVTKKIFIDRITNILNAAIDNNIEAIVLGAFGCGAFKNPPNIVAEAFKYVLEELNYKIYFSEIVFAIKRTDTPCPNIMAFEMVFCIAQTEANLLRFSDSFGLAQAVGEIYMPSGRILKGGNEFNLFQKWQRNNKFYNKQFAILGDSISTLEGYNQKGCSVFYKNSNCELSGVKSYLDTWWGKVINFFSGELLSCNVYCTTKDILSDNQTNKNISSLQKCSVLPDVIIIFLGTNDWKYGTILEEFKLSYNLMLQNLKSSYPEAQIFCSTLCTTYVNGYEENLAPFVCNGIHIEKYCSLIKEIANENKCNIIDYLAYKIPYETLDGTHPTLKGMNTLSTIAIREICSKDCNKDESDTYSGVNFLDCENDCQNLPPKKGFLNKLFRRS